MRTRESPVFAHFVVGGGEGGVRFIFLGLECWHHVSSLFP
jgi:hypothetical protein